MQLLLLHLLLVAVGLLLRVSAAHRCDCSGIEFSSKEYFCGDHRLGPQKLSTTHHLVPLLYGYQRLGGLCPAEFLQKWYNDSTYSYVEPPADGWQLSTAQNPIADDQVLYPGMLVDWFGQPEEQFSLFPAGTPFAMRAIPPYILNTPTYGDIAPFNYHVYKVAYPFVVTSGPRAAFYGQIGQGTIYRTRITVAMLMQGGFLTRVKGRIDDFV
ncbi:hypothetical protein C8F04DRAFT_327238 [Mycena alexandri]|uniref:TNT domain-containing protein n=1 Tax=Mycena alexandri TaxID=1745969 RepID=A0AAD6S2N8_9AGAR|nr:hypothetical protein C8F04DRAFT_327238 [Mycena alexandri]